jgi:hypothetical protein
MQVVFYRNFVKGFRRPFFDGDSANRALPETGAEPVAVDLTYQPRFAIDYLERAFSALRYAGAASVAFLLVYFHDFSNGFDSHFFTSSAFFSSSGLSSPINCFQRSSPRHCLACAHHSMQEGILSLKTIVPHFWQRTLVSSEKISTSAWQFGHRCISTLSFLIS